jgi:hypothetical protein
LQEVLRERLGFLGALLGGLFEFAWAIVTYFVVPVLVAEKAGPIEAVKRSSAIIKSTWGESLTGEAGMGVVSTLLILPVLFGAPVLATLAGTAGDGIGAGVVIALAVAYVVALTVVFTALGAIFRTGTYVYATTGQAPAALDAKLLQSAFRRK